jgi:large subunit ribosomal protein L4
MDIKITTLAGKEAGKVELSEGIFGLDPREDILQRVVRWQLAKRQQGSHKAKDGGIVVLDKASLKEAKTKALISQFGKLSLANALIIDGAELEMNFATAARNIPNIDVLPIQGINVYDIMRRKTLVLTKAAVDALEARFK